MDEKERKNIYHYQKDSKTSPFHIVWMDVSGLQWVAHTQIPKILG